jgi:putative ABC transport system permease protein
MRLLALLSLALKSLRNRLASVSLTLAAIAVSVMLFTGVEKIRSAAEDSFERTVSGADLIVGARSGPVNLVLYSIFRIGDATSNITWRTYQEIASRPEIAWSIPLSLGDSHRGYRVVGTTTALFDHYQYGEGQKLRFVQGAAFSDLFDVVLGAEAARDLGYDLGDELVIAHGLGEVSFADHDDKPFRVAGILAPTGTPVDRSLHVSLEAVRAIHVGWETGARSPVAAMMTADRVRQLNLEPDSITAAIIGLKSRPSVLRLQREINTYREEALLAVIPGVALAQLWEVIGVVERTLAAVSACVVIVGLIVILVTILTSLNERRREMAILRSVGARPGDIFVLLVIEAGMLALIGSVLGLVLLYASLSLAEPLVRASTGVSIASAPPGGFDILVVATVFLAASALAAFPAWRAVRNAIADGLSIRV